MGTAGGGQRDYFDQVPVRSETNLRLVQKNTLPTTFISRCPSALNYKRRRRPHRENPVVDVTLWYRVLGRHTIGLLNAR